MLTKRTKVDIANIIDRWITMLRSNDYRQAQKCFLRVGVSESSVFIAHTDPKSVLYSYCCLGLLQLAHNTPLVDLVVINSNQITKKTRLKNTPIEYLAKIPLNLFYDRHKYPVTHKAITLYREYCLVEYTNRTPTFFEHINDKHGYTFDMIADIVEEIKDKLVEAIHSRQ